MIKCKLLFYEIALLTFILVGCSNGRTDKLVRPVQSLTGKEASSQETSKIKFNEILEKYNDYFRSHHQIVALLDYPYNENGFTDAGMAAFAIMSMDNYSYDKGNTREEYNAITEKYFGRKIENFNNEISEVI